MNRTLSNVLLFAAGVVVGSAVTWKIFKSRYEFIEEEFDTDELEVDGEIDEEPNEESEEFTTTNSSFSRKPPIKEYAQIINSSGYATVEVEEVEGDEDVYEPYVIRPEEYGEIHAYETLSLNYYADGVLTDDLDNRIEDVESIVPADFADHFGEYEEYAVFVRNDERQCDYEILRDTRRFVDVVGDDPYPLEDE